MSHKRFELLVKYICPDTDESVTTNIDDSILGLYYQTFEGEEKNLRFEIDDSCPSCGKPHILNVDTNEIEW